MKLFLILSLVVSIMSCASQKSGVSPAKIELPIRDGKYDSEFPVKPSAPYLDRMARAVKLISTMTFYKAYQFGFEEQLRDDDLKNPQILSRAQTTYIFQRPSSGTATLISQNDRELIFLTCNHIVNHQDTIITYYAKKDQPREPSEIIHSISFKIKETMNILGIPSAGQPVLLASDEKTDLALVGVKLHRMPANPLLVLNIKFGKAAELQWGAFIYLLSYPQGKLMLSHSVVSQPNRDDKHNFLFNSSLTRGISGGIVIALRDGVPNFEVVGIVSALGAQTQYFLRPDINMASWMFDSNQPYKGDIFIDQQIGNNSGIVFAISSENIIDFIKQNKEKIEAQGFRFPSFFLKTDH